ncbi:hypothetical protein [Spiroplasma endosymbiont of Labia minor]|uniref:hypothetical protein n=1 Tax=Spiroplasma endosymbiont of Labia minor TaxID=3066305 RepID=UPI0030D2E144
MESANVDIEFDNFLNKNDSEMYFKIIEATSIINGDFQWILIKHIFLNSADFFIFTDFKYYYYGE